jgi:nucleoside-diphosphate-sugar epimerase
MPATRILVTGASGFLGDQVLAALDARDDVQVIAACRTPDRLRRHFTGELRTGDLRDPGYRRKVVQDVDVVCHAGTWSSLWNHKAQERTHFYEPSAELVECAIAAGVRRFLVASTVAIATPPKDGSALDDFAPPRRTGFWPHLDRLVELDDFMSRRASPDTQMVTLRLGHFVGAGNRLGLVSVLASRLRSRLVPWLAKGRARIALVGDSDLGTAFALAATAPGLADYESFNICGPEFPSLREVIDFITAETGLPSPWYSVPYPVGHAFGGVMEALHPLLPGASPFLTRSIVYLARDWYCPNTYASAKLGYVPAKDWQTATREALAELRAASFPRPRLAQAA